MFLAPFTSVPNNERAGVRLLLLLLLLLYSLGGILILSRDVLLRVGVEPPRIFFFVPPLLDLRAVFLAILIIARILF